MQAQKRVRADVSFPKAHTQASGPQLELSGLSLWDSAYGGCQDGDARGDMYWRKGRPLEIFTEKKDITELPAGRGMSEVLVRVGLDRNELAKNREPRERIAI